MKNKTIRIILLAVILMLTSIIAIIPVMAYSVPVIEPETSGATKPIENAGGQVARHYSSNSSRCSNSNFNMASN